MRLSHKLKPQYGTGEGAIKVVNAKLITEHDEPVRSLLEVEPYTIARYGMEFVIQSFFVV